MRGVDDRIVIDGFYENARPPTDEETRLLTNLIDALGPDGLNAMYGVTDFRKGLEGLDFVREVIFGPTLNIDGFLAGQPEAGIKTIVPASAKCQLDIRLVPDMTIQEVLDKVHAHLDRHGYEDIKLRFLGGYNPAKTSIEQPVAQAAIQSVRKLGGEPRFVPMLPSAGPIIMFIASASIISGSAPISMTTATALTDGAMPGRPSTLRWSSSGGGIQLRKSKKFGAGILSASGERLKRLWLSFRRDHEKPTGSTTLLGQGVRSLRFLRIFDPSIRLISVYSIQVGGLGT